MSVTCSRCDSEVAVRLKKSHDCVRALRAVISQYAKIISQQQEMIDKLTASSDTQMTVHSTHFLGASAYGEYAARNPYRLGSELMSDGLPSVRDLGGSDSPLLRSYQITNSRALASEQLSGGITS